MNVTIANRLAEIRRMKKFSQEELAERIGVSRQAISKWERAEASPDTDNLILLAELYGMSLDDLIKGELPIEEIRQTQNFTQSNQQQSVDPQPSTESWSSPSPSPPEPEMEQNPAYKKWMSFPFPVLVTALYLALGFMFNWWHPGWMLFLIVPFYYTTPLVPKMRPKNPGEAYFDGNMTPAEKKALGIGILFGVAILIVVIIAVVLMVNR